MNDTITDVPGVRVGHVTDRQGLTGVTVLRVEEGAVGSVAALGGAVGSASTQALHPLDSCAEVHAVVLTGGSNFGLATTVGVTRWLAERGFGLPTIAARIPIVPAAVVYDLRVGDSKAHPTVEDGYRACEVAADGPIAQGSVGAGTGATAGKWGGGVPVSGGLGTASAALPGGIIVGAIVVVNPVGDVVNPATGRLYAQSGGFTEATYARAAEAAAGMLFPTDAQNTTIACVATNARLDKTQLACIARMAHDGIARAVRPLHTMRDGDTVFALSVGREARIEAPGQWAHALTDVVGTTAADVLTRAIVNAVLHADPLPGFPKYANGL